MTGSGADSAPPVEVRDLVKRYKAVTAVGGVSFTLERGSVTALLGGNGAGKTTTIAILLGLLVPTSGDVRVFGARMPEQRGLVAWRMNFESPYLDMPQRLTVRQNLTVYARLYGVEDVKGRIATLAEALQISELLERPNGKLSAGQKTRVSLAKALLNAPELLLLDEPTASLDPETADWLRGTLQDYAARRGATILFASHNMTEVERLSDRVIMLSAGRIIEDAAPAELIRKYGRKTLEDVFIDLARRGREPANAAI
ncbi:MAG: ABC transporter ATP-binding protein [Hyphomicrobiales bacterium]